MRVIAGQFKGRTLAAPDWTGLRPTSDKLRETLFNILGPSVRGATVLDGYAGTGAVGLEALSRGASHVTFVERDARAVRLIEANLARCGLGRPDGRPATVGRAAPPPSQDVGQPRYAIIRAGFPAATPPQRGAAFDIIFLDPPYGATGLVEALSNAAPLAGGATVLVLEHAKRDAAPDRTGDLVRTRGITSGDSALTFYRRLTEAAGSHNGGES